MILSGGVALFGAPASISGQVTNGTTGRPVANQKLRLIMPSGGMQEVATAVTDAAGRFSMAADNLTSDSFYLLEANYQDVNYNAPVQFDQQGRAQAQITVYDATHTAPPLRIQSARIILRAEGNKLHVQEMFAIRNLTSPARTYVNDAGTFAFHLGSSAGEPTAAIAGVMNMPLSQPVSSGKQHGDYSLASPLKPGLSVISITYDSDYSGNKLDWEASVGYPVDTAELLVSPPALSVGSVLFQPQGTDAETGSRRYLASGVTSGTPLSATLSGEAVPAETPASPAGPEVKSLPNSMTRLGAPLLACFLLLLFWGLGVRVAKEWPRFKEQRSAEQQQKALAAEVESLFNSLADLDELFAAGKIAEKAYWKERLDLKARLVTALKKAPPKLLESYATRHASH